MAPDLKTELVRNRRARDRFERIPMSQKKQFLWWIVSAKREETKMKGIGKAIELLTDKKSMNCFYGRRKSTG